MAVDIETEPSFAAGSARELLTGYYAGLPARTYDIAPDGSRFLMLRDSAENEAVELIVVLNWPDELNRLARGQ